MKRHFLACLLSVLVLISCGDPNNSSEENALQSGFRYSSYGPSYNPGPEYWPYVGEQMAAKFPGSNPAALWIVGIVDGDGTYLNLPCEQKIHISVAATWI